jgi:hypothetical protein
VRSFKGLASGASHKPLFFTLLGFKRNRKILKRDPGSLDGTACVQRNLTGAQNMGHTARGGGLGWVVSLELFGFKILQVKSVYF